MKQLKPEETLKDVAAALAVVKHAGRVGMVGFCWGGRIAYLARMRAAAGLRVSSYYGGGITQILDKKPKCPVMYHFGERDKHITPDDVAKIKAAHPEGIFHMYPADHGFNCDSARQLRRAERSAGAQAHARILRASTWPAKNEADGR